MRGCTAGWPCCAREGSLTVSDAYGSITAEANGGPRIALTGEAPGGGLGPTLYARVGDTFGSVIFVLAAFLISWTVWAQVRSRGATNAD